MQQDTPHSDDFVDHAYSQAFQLPCHISKSAVTSRLNVGKLVYRLRQIASGLVNLQINFSVLNDLN